MASGSEYEPPENEASSSPLPSPTRSRTRFIQQIIDESEEESCVKPEQPRMQTSIQMLDPDPEPDPDCIVLGELTFQGFNGDPRRILHEAFERLPFRDSVDPSGKASIDSSTRQQDRTENGDDAQSMDGSEAMESDAVGASVKRRRVLGRKSSRSLRATGTQNVRTENEIRRKYQRSRYKNTKHKDVKEMIARRHDNTAVVKLRPFAKDRVFESWEEFFAAVQLYMDENHLLFRRRSSVSSEINNRNFGNPMPGNYPTVPFRVPADRFEYVKVTYWCTHKCINPSRGKGLRTHNHVRFTGCDGGFIGIVERDDNGEFGIVVRQQVALHNHIVNEEVYTALKQHKILPTDELVEQIDLLRRAKAPMRELADFISDKIGHTVTNQQVRNFLKARLGGPRVEEKIKRLVEDYVGIDGNHCLVVLDSDDVMAGLVLVNKAQAEMYKIWGEVLLFDWTHNTNNRGFYLGELMATAGHGKGISVCEMLVLDQTKETMKRCLEFFASVVDARKTETFVIDKDFTEWSVLNEVFPSAKVLLCQFHAIQAIQRALKDVKYGIDVSTRKELEMEFRELMYERSEREYKRKWKLLKERCDRFHGSYGDYLKRNWHECREMWANHGRRQHFTAGNTTNNRLEATWKQMKSMLNLNCGIDQCLASVIQYQNGSMAELRKDIIEKQARRYYNATESDEIAELGSALSDFSLKFVRGVYATYVRQRNKLGVVRMTQNEVEVVSSGKVYRVNFEPPGCSCSGFLESRLFCAHICYASLDIKKYKSIPVKMIPERWNFSGAIDLVPTLRQSMLMNKILWRKLVDELPRTPTSVASVGTTLSPNGQVKKVSYVKLKKNERSSEGTLVRSDVEKYNIAMATLKPVIDALVGSSTVEFYPKMRLLEDATATLLRVFSNATDNYATGTDVCDSNSGSTKHISGVREATLQSIAPSPSNSAASRQSASLPGVQDVSERCDRNNYLPSTKSELNAGKQKAQSDHNVTPTEQISRVKPVSTPTGDFMVRVASQATVLDLRAKGTSASSDSDSVFDVDSDASTWAVALSDFAQSTDAAPDVSADFVAGKDSQVEPEQSDGREAIIEENADVSTNPTSDSDAQNITGVGENAQQSFTLEEVSSSPIKSQEVRQLTSTGYLKVIKLPRPIHSGSKNNQRRRNSTKKLIHPRLEAVIAIEDWKCGVCIKDVAAWLEYSRNQSFVTAVLKKTPIVLRTLLDINRKVFVVEDDGSAEGELAVVFSKPLVDKILEEIRKTRQRLYSRRNGHTSSQLAVRVHKDLPVYQGSLILAMDKFHKLASANRQLEKTFMWLRQDWTSWTCRFNVMAVDERQDAQLAQDILSALSVSSLSTIVEIPHSSFGSCGLTELLSVSDENWLTESPIGAMLQEFCNLQTRSVCISSFVSEHHLWEIPLELAPGQVIDLDGESDGVSNSSIAYKQWEVAVSACHVTGNHWTLAVIDLVKHEVLVYDPMSNDTWVDMTEERCREVLIPVVELWRKRYAEKMRYDYTKIRDWDFLIIEGPQQSDFNSCGVLVLAVAWSYLLHGMAHPLICFNGKLPLAESNVYRLRILWRCLCSPGSRPVVRSPPNPQHFARIDAQMQQQISTLE